MNMPSPDADSSKMWERAMTDEEFFATNPQRHEPGWIGYGVSWRQPGQPNISLIYCGSTQEVFAIRGSTDYIVLASLEHQEFEQRIRGWSRVHLAQRPNSFEWVLERL